MSVRCTGRGKGRKPRRFRYFPRIRGMLMNSQGLGSAPTGKVKSLRPERVMQISGPLDGPKVAIQAISAQQPGD